MKLTSKVISEGASSRSSRPKVPCVGLLARVDGRVSAQAGVQLVPTDIHGHDRAAPRGASTWVKPPVELPMSRQYTACGVYAEMVQRGRELHAAARHPRDAAVSHREPRRRESPPSLRTGPPSTVTSPAAMASCARARLSKRPSSTSAMSARLRALMACTSPAGAVKVTAGEGGASAGITVGDHRFQREDFMRSVVVAILAGAVSLGARLPPALRRRARRRPPTSSEQGRLHRSRATARRCRAGVVLRVTLKAGSCTPGWHGMHLHASGDCGDVAAFQNAKAHVNHDAKKHGLLNPEGPDNGDLPNIYVQADGSARRGVHLAGAADRNERPARRRRVGPRDPRRRRRPHRAAHRQCRRAGGAAPSSSSRLQAISDFAEPLRVRLAQRRQDLGDDAVGVEAGLRRTCARACPGRG